MAIQIKKLGTRAFTALFFVLILLGCLLWNYYSFSLLFIVVSMWGLLEFYQIAEGQGIKPYRLSGFTGGVLVYVSFLNFHLLSNCHQYLQLHWLAPAALLIIFATAVFDTSEKPFTNAVWTLFGLGYAVLPFALLHLLVASKIGEDQAVYLPEVLLGIILLIWCNDTFAYLGGSILGKRKMIERVSPGKTWEGTVTGVLCSIGGSFLLAHFLIAEDQLFWIICGFAVPVLATIGDLFESVMKRQAGIKDTGSIMPGHGGILDRFDSLIFVSPFVVLLVSLRG